MTGLSQAELHAKILRGLDETRKQFSHSAEKKPVAAKPPQRASAGRARPASVKKRKSRGS